MKRTVVLCAMALSCGLLAMQATAQTTGRVPVRGGKSSFSFDKANLAYHGGPVITAPKVVFIFWGPSFSNVASPDYSYAQSLRSFRNQLGTTPEFFVITQYSGVQLTNLAAGTADWFDTSLPPTQVTDSLVRSKVTSYLSSHPFDANTIYEVVLPSTSYAVDGNGRPSCGVMNPQICAYHSWYLSGFVSIVKYSVQPYPSCGGCQTSGWSAAQSQDHFILHETREAATDPLGNGWYESGTGDEADDRCNWNPSPFIGTGGYGYQYEWSNALATCVQSTPLPTYEPYNCAWSGNIKESSGITYICPSSKVVIGRWHSGDENGNTQYYCCNVRAVGTGTTVVPTTCAWSASIKESSGIAYTCPSSKVVAGRWHGGDENGNSQYYCCNLDRGGALLTVDGTTCAWSTDVKESSGITYTCTSSKQMVGRKHSGDENGNTQYYCCDVR
jgi:hypothetical protein